MDERLAKALAIVEERTGFGSFKKPVVRKTNEDAAHNQATRSSKPRSQRGRKYNAKAEAKRAAWRREKGFKTRKEQQEDPQMCPTAAITDVPTAEVNSAGILKPVIASTAGKGFLGDWLNIPCPVMPRSGQQIDTVLTRKEAIIRGYIVQVGGGMYSGVVRYKVSDGAPWIVCREEDAPAKPVPSPRPAISELFARSLPVGIDRRCEHAKLGLPPDGTCHGDCQGTGNSSWK